MSCGNGFAPGVKVAQQPSMAFQRDERRSVGDKGGDVLRATNFSEAAIGFKKRFEAKGTSEGTLGIKLGNCVMSVVR